MDKTPEADRSAAAGPRPWILVALALGMALAVLWLGWRLDGSHQKDHYWFYLAPWDNATSLKYLACAALAALAWRGFGDRLRRWLPALFAAILLGAQVWYAATALRTLGGRVPWGFDHPSFMFRLQEFGELFPFAIGAYNPWWNAGIEHYAGVTSGAHAFGYLNLPLLLLFEPHRIHGLALVFWFVFGFPWLGVLAVRAAGARWTGALCAGGLLCGISRVAFFWAWHYGTVGAMTSAMMAAPVAALGYRLAVRGRGGWGTALALGLSAWLTCLWTPGVFVAGGLGLGWLWNWRRWTWRGNLRLAAAGALALALWAPYLWAATHPASYAAAYFSQVVDRPGPWAMLAGGARRLWIGFQEWHPVLFWLGLGGLLAAERELRRWLLPVFLVVGALAGWSREWSALSQLDRLIIPLAVVAAVPAGFLCGRLFEEPFGADGSRRRAWLASAARGTVTATLLFGLLVPQWHYANHGPARMRTLSAEMDAFVDWIRAEVPPEGRLAFAGKMVHLYGGGNTAYLPVLTGREMMGDDYYGFPRGTAEYDYPPAYYRASPERHRFFAQAYGITHWVAARPEDQAYLRSRPEWFEFAQAFTILKNRIEVYRERGMEDVSRFYAGTGRVEARINRLAVFPADPAAERVVLRYNWRAGLRCLTPGAAIEPFAVDENLTFIAVRPGGHGRIDVGYRTHAEPIRPNFDGYLQH